MESTTIYRENAAEQISEQLKPLLSRDIVLLCLGTENVTGDSLGPRVGTLIQNKMKRPLLVYGYEGCNVNAQNLVLAYDMVRVMHPEKQIVVIDAAVGDNEEVGCVQIHKGGIMPGAATNKNLPQVGDVSILGVVSKRGCQDFYSSHSDRVMLVEKMAETIAESIIMSA